MRKIRSGPSAPLALPLDRCLAILLFGCAIQAEIVDRAAIVVGRQVVTELALEEEVRVTEFLNQTPLDVDLATRQAAADRTIEQLLIAREMDLSRYPGPGEAEIQRAFDSLRDRFPNRAAFHAALAAYQLDETTVKQHLARQISALHFIEYRFRPELGISEADLQTSYKTATESWAAQHPGSRAPTFEDSRAPLRTALIEKRTDQALDDWLKETRRQIKIVFLEKRLRATEAVRE